MSRGINKVILIGHVGREPETKYMPSGAAVTNFSVATSESWKDKQTGEKKERTEWHNIVAFKHLSEVANKYLHKGSKVYVEGSLKTELYEKDGEKRYSTKIVARSIQMLDSPPRSDSNDLTHDASKHAYKKPAPPPGRVLKEGKPPPPTDQPQGAFNATDPFGDELPF